MGYPRGGVLDRVEGAMLGLAVGDALGMPIQYTDTTFDEATMRGGGPFNLPAGYWTDETAMALCLADSILASGGYDSFDVMDRYTRWWKEGYRSATGRCEDIGATMVRSLASYAERPRVPTSARRTQTAGNSPLGRLAPLVIASYSAGNSIGVTRRLAAISARETHYSRRVEQYTAAFAAMVHTALGGGAKSEVLAACGLDLAEVRSWERGELKATGFVLDTIDIAAWSLATTRTFADGARSVVSFGGDASTNGAVFGQLAGAFYGISGIPGPWLHQLHEGAQLLGMARSLADTSSFGVVATRFDEDLASDAAARLPRGARPADQVAGMPVGVERTPRRARRSAEALDIVAID